MIANLYSFSCCFAALIVKFLTLVKEQSERRAKPSQAPIDGYSWVPVEWH